MAANSEESQKIRVMTYNIRYGAGSKNDGYFLPRAKEDVQRNLDGIAKLVAQEKIDILCLQEVDYNSHRTNNLDQANYLKERIDEETGAEHEMKSKNGVIRPPYVSFIRPLRELELGNTTISRFPIKESTGGYFTDWQKESCFKRFAKLITLKDFRMNYLDCKLDLGGGKVLSVLNTHLDTYNPELRQYEADILKGVSRKKSNPYLLAGDLNALPPHSKDQHGFKEDAFSFLEDYRKDDTINRLIKEGDFHVPHDLDPQYAVNGHRFLDSGYFTFPSTKPNRGLDHILISPDLQYASQGGKEAYRVLQGVPYSDHLPVVAEIVVK